VGKVLSTLAEDRAFADFATSVRCPGEVSGP
jgi:hypothetical protein